MVEHESSLHNIGIVVAVTRMHGRLARLNSWITDAAKSGIDVHIVHDVRDSLTGPELKTLVSQAGSPRIKIYEGNFGSPGSARNHGLKVSDNKWVVFWDSDDFGDVKQLIRMTNKIAAKKLDAINLIVANFSVWDDTRRVALFKNSPSMNTPSNMDNLVNNLGLWRCVFRKESITHNFPTWKMAEDQYFFLTNFEVDKTLFRQETIYNYFINVDNQLTSNSQAVVDLMKSVNAIQGYLKTGTNTYLAKGFLIRQSLTLLLSESIKVKLRGLILYSKCLFLHPGRSLRILHNAFTYRNFRTPKNGDKPTNMALIGGLGNQLFQIAAALAHSKSGKLNVVLPLSNTRSNESGSADVSDFNFPFEVHFQNGAKVSKQFNRVLNLSLRIGISKNRITESFLVQFPTKVLASILLSTYFRRFKWITTGHDVGYTKLKEDKGKKFFMGYFQSCRYLLDNEIAAEKFSEIKLSTYSDELRLWISKIQFSKPIVVHIRLGDYLQESDFGVIGSDYYKRALEICEAKGLGKEVWVFSDDIKMAREKYSDVFANHPFWFEDNKLSSAETLELMRHGNSYVIANSTFSWWAAYLSYNSEKCVVAPSCWFKSLPSPLEILPDDWLQIEPDFVDLLNTDSQFVDKI